jgi:putative endonuclease
LVRMPPCHGGGRGFESRPVRRKVAQKGSLFRFMTYYVYIIQSFADNSYYKGYSENPVKRLQQHNNGESVYTSAKTPWQLVYAEEMPDKRAALLREKALKKYSHEQIIRLINSYKNQLVIILGRFAG